MSKSRTRVGLAIGIVLLAIVIVAATTSPLFLLVAIVPIWTLCALELWSMRSDNQIYVIEQALVTTVGLASAFMLAVFLSYGVWLVLVVVAIVVANDWMAYYFGKEYGGGTRKLAPNVSPNKTVVGFVAGWVLSTLFGLALGALAWLVVSRELGWQIIALAIIVPPLAVIGDLFESAVKRIANVGDSGEILLQRGGSLGKIERAIQSHGGAVDRTDSFVFAFACIAVAELFKSAPIVGAAIAAGVVVVAFATIREAARRAQCC